MEFKTALPYLIGVYVGIWVGVLVFLISMQGQISGLRKKLEVLTKAVEKKAAEPAPETVNV
ncbi:MAG: hypothetical protein ACYC1U_07870 [Candidatus Aquicultorales bacterium]